VLAQVPTQRNLFDRGEPRVHPARLVDRRRVALDESAWVEYLPGFVSGQEALMDALVGSTRWHSERREMYDRMVEVPRLVAALPDDGPGHRLLQDIRTVLAAEYRVDFPRLGLGYYRNGADSVAWHGDYVARKLPEALVATVSLGEPRRFLLRPRPESTPAPGSPPRSRQRSVTFSLGRGDLLVMGGACQRTWQHALPKVAFALPRLAVMFRPIWQEPAPATR
jgi:alkylated DNA repair dioxygenase AlkB